jgi:hypothetical protein
VEVVFANFTQAAVMIDDFQVPDDPDYYYDDYGSTGALTLTYLREAALPSMNFFFLRLRAVGRPGEGAAQSL